MSSAFGVLPQPGGPLRMSTQIPPSVLPRVGFLPSYVSHASALTDAPPMFHLAVGLTILAAAAGNRIRTHAWGQDVPPHLWAVLVAPSSYFRKSTSLAIGQRLLQRAVPEAVLANDFSRERFLESLQENPSGVIPVAEFSGLLAVLGRDYMGGTKEALTELYDAPPRWERKLQSKTVTIISPAISILGASTLDWLQERVTEGDVRGGFMARVLFFVATEKLPWKALVTHESVEVATELVRVLAAVAKHDQNVTIGSEAKAHYDAWLERHESDEHVDGHLQGFHSRLETAALKLSLLYQISADVPRALVPARVELNSMAHATALADMLWANTRRVVLEGFSGSTRYGPQLRRVEELIGHNGGIERRDLLRRSHLRIDELEPLVRTLEETGIVTHRAEQKSGKVTVVYFRAAASEGGQS